MSQAAPQVLCRADDVLGEGPLWDHRSSSLLWVDILRGCVHSWSEVDGVCDVLQMDALIGSIALVPLHSGLTCLPSPPRRPLSTEWRGERQQATTAITPLSIRWRGAGGEGRPTGQSDLLLATSKGIYRHYALSGETRLLIHPLEGKPLRFNDGRVDALGRFWVGTMAIDPAHYSDPWGELYRYDPDGTLHRMEEGLTISNGLDWSPDGKTFYLTDTMRRAIYAYDFNLGAGTIENRRIFVQTAEEDGYPDGLVADTTGSIWSAGFGGGAICRYDTDGRRVERIAMPVTCPTALTFGGEDDATAFITSSKHVLSPDHTETEAGAVFAAQLGARGQRSAVFGQGDLR